MNKNAKTGKPKENGRKPKKSDRMPKESEKN